MPTVRFILELGGQFEQVQVKAIEGGARVGVVLTAAPAAGSFFSEKHLSGVRYEPIAITNSFSDARPLFDWITTAWRGTVAKKNGAVIRDESGGPREKREFVNGVLMETTIPMLDAASRNAADFTLRLAPELTRDVPPPTTLPDPPNRRERFISSNFRLDISGLDCNQVSKIDSFTVKQKLLPNLVEFPNLRIELSSATAASWRSWFQSFAIDGHSDATNERTGTLTLLSQDFHRALATISFFNLGIFRLDNVPASEPIRVVADLYCERMDLAIPPV
jgi:hypothetical protein